MTYTRNDLENDLQEHLANVAKELADIGNDGTEEDAARQADRRHELLVRQRELSDALAESKAKHEDGGYREALARQMRRLETPADSRRVELDERVKRFMRETGETNYASAAKKLVELERMA